MEKIVIDYCKWCLEPIDFNTGKNECNDCAREKEEVERG